jgi:hypothetical protein
MGSVYLLIGTFFSVLAVSAALLDVKLMSVNVMAADEPQNGCYPVIVTGVVLTEADNRTEPIPAFGGASYGNIFVILSFVSIF